MDKAKKIKKDLEQRFPRARFSVTVGRKDDVTVNHVGGHDYSDVFPTYREAVRELTKVIKQTIPGFEWTDYTKRDGKPVYRK
jgi:uncharacterized protein with HEPN domain